MAVPSTLAAYLAASPFNPRPHFDALSALIADIVGTAAPAAVVAQGIVASPLNATTMTLDGRVASDIKGGRATGAVVLGVAGGSGGALGGRIENVCFDGAVSVVRGSWVFVNCTFRSTLAVASNTTLVGGSVVGVATRTAGTASASLTNFASYPVGTWTLVFPDTTP